jgi:hypothetical protein
MADLTFTIINISTTALLKFSLSPVNSSISFAADAWSGEVRSTLVSTFTRDNWDIVDVELTKSTEWLREQLGKKYDWLGILG